jgi:hypothetical protein
MRARKRLDDKMALKQILAWTFLAASPCLLAEGLERYKQVSVTNTDRAPFMPGGTIRVNDSSGHVMVEGWDQSEVEVTVVKSMPYGYNKDQATQKLDRVKVSMQRLSPTELAIATVPSHRGKVMIDYQIHVPRDSKLVIHSVSNYILVSRVSGEIEATCSRGDIVVMLPDAGQYSIDAKSKFGNVFSDFEGRSHSPHLIGDQFASTNSAPSRRIYLRVRSGGITIKGLPAIADVTMQGGAK